MCVYGCKILNVMPKVGEKQIRPPLHTPLGERVSLELLVGTGGWAYFPVAEGSRLKAYSRVFNFAEVNSTFYEYLDPRRVEQWRKIVPADFTFAVRCHQDLTHRIHLEPTEEAYRVMGKMLTYCRILESPFLVLETPASYVFTGKRVSASCDFLSSVDLEGVQLVWENRALLTSEAKAMMQDRGIVHSVDLSTQAPLFDSDVLYSRVFGKGKHNLWQFTDEELEEIAHKIFKSQAKTVALSYHGARMFTDAIRFAQYQKTGKFLSVTRYTGVPSARAVLAEDAKFPVTKQRLIADQGWKVFDATAEKRLHLWEWLQTIPDKTYGSVDEVAQALEAQF